jgi:hypothetical protein
MWTDNEAEVLEKPAKNDPATEEPSPIVNGYGTCRNSFRCGCTGYQGWGAGYACSRCGCGFGEHY